MASLEQAKQIVGRLTKKYGFLNEDMMADIGRWKPEYRREIDENWLAIESTAAHSVKTLAKQIYGSGARFVFELLQNADDNTFDEDVEMPFISFKVHPNHIVVECNEKGFTEKDLDAICAVGQSTKTASHGYIGAKGIGFKSVFIAAWKVYIQSGHFSFDFRHRKNDPGLGMVRPIWVDANETLEQPLTRMTLHLHDEGDEAELDHLREIIFKQLDELQQTCLLFVRKLREISVEFYDDRGRLQRSKYFSKHDHGQHRVCLLTTSVRDGITSHQKQFYHLTEQVATGLTRSDNRELPDTDEARIISGTADVILAFPITDESKPLLNQKHEIFAFLPVRESDYKFLIHSDFDTSANRQDIVTTSRRNMDLLDWVARAFVKAVGQFCDDPVLCYDWPLFLPSQESGSTAFWSSFEHKLRAHLAKTPVLKSRNRTDLRLIQEVAILTEDLKYGEEKLPVFDDEEKDPFLSPKYPSASRTMLNNYGLQKANESLIYDLLKQDLNSPNPVMHDDGTGEEWHTVVAKLFCRWFTTKPLIANQLKSLPLLPLREGGYTSTQEGPVYFPTTNGINIPSALDIRILCPVDSEPLDCRALFEHLGASNISVNDVRASILRVTGPNGGPIYLSNLRAYLHYLYLTHTSEAHIRTELRMVRLADNNGYQKWAHTTDLFLPSGKHPYGPDALLSPFGASPGLLVVYLGSLYMENVPEKPTSDHSTWERWLYDWMGIRERLRLKSRDQDTLSEAFLYVLKHRSDKFLGLFEHLWMHESSKLKTNSVVRRLIENLPAQDLCTVNFPLTLKETWLPLPSLQSSVSRFMEHPEQFPFLKFEDLEMEKLSTQKWDFLHAYFSVGKDETVDFLLKILHYVQKSCPGPFSIRQSQMVFDLYIAIYAKMTLNGKQKSDREKIKNFFSKGGVLIPGGFFSATWTSSSICLWNGPPVMTSKYSLKSLYSKTLGDEQLTGIANLFSGIAEIPAASFADIVVELQEIEVQDVLEQGEVDHVTAIYEYIVTLRLPKNTLRQVFSEKPLIYAEKNGEPGMYRTSDCLWSSTTSIRGKVSLDELYDGMRDFFVDTLGVRSLTLQMVYDELQQDTHTSSVEDVKTAIFSFNSQLQTDRTTLDPAPVLKNKIFPVKYPNGTVELRSIDTEFAIGDRDYLTTKFQHKVSMLDFDLEDVRRLTPFLEWARLQNRYLSNCVKEISTISEGAERPVSSSNRDLKRKAYYILRIAATFNSPRFQADPSALYQLLRTAKVIETDQISSVLRMSQNNQVFEAEEPRGNEHISETSSGLTIYVPRKRRAQEICFGSVLPRKLTEWLMRDGTSQIVHQSIDTDAVSTMTSVLACSRSALDEILDRQGIIKIGIENQDVVQEDEDDNDDAGDSEEQLTPIRQTAQEGSSYGDYAESDTETLQNEDSDTETLVNTVVRQSNMSFRPRQSQGVVSVSTTQPFRRSELLRHSTGGTLNRFPISRAVPARSSSDEDATYRVLLGKVIEAARRATFPSQGAFDMSNMRNALPEGEGNFESFDGLEIASRFRSSSQLERDKKIGAAGELYVFELLSKLHLPSWGRSNWQSTIKHYTTVHPEYADMQPWTSRETADIVYKDTTGSFTEKLIDDGYIDNDDGDWNEAKPTYYIEVKTTTGPCHTQFFMSGNQYQLMTRIHHSDDYSEVYMVFRVYSLESNRIGMRIYSDPEHLRQMGELVFKGHTWCITPGDGTVPVEV